MKAKITLNAVGDVMLGGKVGEKIALKGSDYLFDNVRDVLSGDFVIGNLECPLSYRGTPYFHGSKAFVFRGSPDCAGSLKKAGFNIACLANNHISDYGPVALMDTINHLERHHISHIGAGSNSENACRPLLKVRRGITVGFLAFAFGNRAQKRSAGCCPCDPAFVSKTIRTLRQKVNLVIASIHQGIEYVDYPGRNTVALFRGAVDAGAAVVLGHHPHVPQGVEIYKGSLIAYSLGNFISDDIDEEVRRTSYQTTALAYFTDNPPRVDDMRTTESFILHCEMDRKGVRDYKLIPQRSNEDFQPTLMDARDSEIFIRRIEGISEKLSDLDDPVWDEMDSLWDKCKAYNLRKITLGSIIRRLHHLRFRHIRLAIPYLRSKIGG